MAAYGYRFSGYFMEFGPVEASDLNEAKTLIRKRLGLARLPRNLQVWDLSVRPLQRWRVVPMNNVDMELAWVQ